MARPTPPPTSDDSGNFDIDSETGVVSTTGPLNHEAGHSQIEVEATSADGSSKSETFNITVNDVNEPVSMSVDLNASENRILETSSSGGNVALVAEAIDPDFTNSQVTYSLSDDAGGRFEIDPSTGQVSLSNSSLIDYDVANTHEVTVLATSQDTSTAETKFQIDVAKIDDADSAANAINLQSFDGAYFGVQLEAFAGGSKLAPSDLQLFTDASGAVSYDTSTGKLHLTSKSNLDYVNTQLLQVEVGLEASQKQSIYIPLYQQPEFEVSGPTADSTTGVFQLEVSLKALPGYDVDVLFDGVKVIDTQTPTVTTPIDQEVSWSKTFELPADVTHGDHNRSQRSLTDRSSNQRAKSC